MMHLCSTCKSLGAASGSQAFQLPALQRGAADQLRSADKVWRAPGASFLLWLLKCTSDCCYPATLPVSYMQLPAALRTSQLVFAADLCPSITLCPEFLILQSIQ